MAVAPAGLMPAPATPRAVAAGVVCAPAEDAPPLVPLLLIPPMAPKLVPGPAPDSARDKAEGGERAEGAGGRAAAPLEAALNRRYMSWYISNTA